MKTPLLSLLIGIFLIALPYKVEAQVPSQNTDPQVLCFGTIEPYCVDCPSADPSGTPGSTYTWSIISGTFTGNIDTNPSFPSSNHIIIDWGTTAPGNYVLQVIEENADGCQGAPRTLNIQILPAITPVTSFTYTTPVCANEPNLLPVTSTGFTTGGTYSSTTGLSINAATGEINVAASTPGTYTVTYAVTASGCQIAGNSTFSVTINNTITPVTSFTYTTPVCANEPNLLPVTPTGFTTGGTYSSTTGLSINAATGEINVAASTPGTYTVTYAVTASGCQIAGNSTTDIIVTPLPSTSPIFHD
jgi:hypothetical protein